MMRRRHMVHCKCWATTFFNWLCRSGNTLSHSLPVRVQLFLSQNFLPPTVEAKTHRLRGPGAGHGWVDHPVLQDWAGGSVPADVQGVGGGIEDLDVLDGAALHCRKNRVVGGQQVIGGWKWKVRLGWKKEKVQREEWKTKKLSRGESWSR